MMYSLPESYMGCESRPESSSDRSLVMSPTVQYCSDQDSGLGPSPYNTGNSSRVATRRELRMDTRHADSSTSTSTQTSPLMPLYFRSESDLISPDNSSSLILQNARPRKYFVNQQDRLYAEQLGRILDDICPPIQNYQNLNNFGTQNLNNFGTQNLNNFEAAPPLPPKNNRNTCYIDNQTMTLPFVETFEETQMSSSKRNASNEGNRESFNNELLTNSTNNANDLETNNNGKEREAVMRPKANMIEKPVRKHLRSSQIHQISENKRDIRDRAKLGEEGRKSWMKSSKIRTSTPRSVRISEEPRNNYPIKSDHSLIDESSIRDEESNETRSNRRIQDGQIVDIVENKKNNENKDKKNNKDNDDKSEKKKMIRRISRSTSPVRSGNSDPGFSTSNRRRLYREAMNELEDMFRTIDLDKDILDRAERRDLPTIHQQLRYNANNDDFNNDDFNEINYDGINNSRIRAPSMRRSATFDSVRDDVINRLKHHHNRPVKSTKTKLMGPTKSYLKSSFSTNNVLSSDFGRKSRLELRKSNERSCINKSASHNEDCVNNEDECNNESGADAELDDMALRRLQDQMRSLYLQEKQPLMGLPNLRLNVLKSSCSSDYLHTLHNSEKYRSRFNSMRIPDLITDDFAFRSLRREESKDISKVAIKPDCKTSFKRGMDRRTSTKLLLPIEQKGLSQLDESSVFYPNKNSRVCFEMSRIIGDNIRRQSRRADADDLDQMATPKLEQMRSRLEDFDKEQRSKQCWRGKTIVDLLTEDNSDVSDVSTATVVLHCEVSEVSPDLSDFSLSQDTKDAAKKLHKSFSTTDLVLNERDVNRTVERSEAITDNIECNSNNLINNESKCDMAVASTMLTRLPKLSEPRLALVLISLHLMMLVHKWCFNIDFVSGLGVIVATLGMLALCFLQK